MPKPSGCSSRPWPKPSGSAPTDPSWPEALDGLGLFYMVRDQDAEADTTLTRALRVEERATGTDSEQVAVSLEHLGLVKAQLRQYDAAESLARRSLAIREKQVGPDDPENAECLNLLSGVLFMKGDIEKAEPFWARSLAIQERTQGPDSVDVARTLQNKAVLLLGQGNSAKMKALFQQVKGLEADLAETKSSPKDENEAAEAEKTRAAVGSFGHAGDIYLQQAEKLFETCPRDPGEGSRGQPPRLSRDARLPRAKPADARRPCPRPDLDAAVVRGS